METNNSNNLPIKPEEVSNIIQTTPAILQRNELSVSSCNKAGKALLDTIEGSQGIDSDELDTAVSDYISKVKVTVTNMNERRKPITQMLTAVSKMFTTMESQIDLKTVGSIPYKLQEARNKYAAKKLTEQKEREEKARRIQLAENEKASYRADVALLLDNAYSNYVEKHINTLNGMFSRITLVTYNDISRQLKEASTAFVWTDFASNISDSIVTYYMDADTRKAIKNEVAAAKKKEFTERYTFELDDLKQSIIDRLPSRRKELEELEELSRTNSVAAAEAEEKRKQQEAEEKAKQEQERKKWELKAKAKADADKATAEAQAAFDFSAASIPDTPANAKVTKKIKVTNPKGYMLLYQMWFTKEGANMTNDDLDKVHKKMITFCEKMANKDGGETIQSPFIQYFDDVKAK